MTDEKKFDIPTLTQEEIDTLSVDAAMRLIAGFTKLMTDINSEMRLVIREKCRVDGRLSELKNDKQTIIELTRSLKVICERP